MGDSGFAYVLALNQSHRVCESGFVFCFAQTPFGKFTELARLLGHEKKYFSAPAHFFALQKKAVQMNLQFLSEKKKKNFFEFLQKISN